MAEPKPSRPAQKLPPLILHPFADSASPGKLMQGSRANLMLQGLLPNEEFSLSQLQELLVEGKICEIRMLFYVGKDLLRWIDQCVEMTSSDSEPQATRWSARSFAELLIQQTPPDVTEKLKVWGVQDYKAIFSRAIGLNSVFGFAPDRTSVSDEFIQAYHYYSDQLYTAWSNLEEYNSIEPGSFTFELYASAEYSRILERQWAAEE